MPDVNAVDVEVHFLVGGVVGEALDFKRLERGRPGSPGMRRLVQAVRGTQQLDCLKRRERNNSVPQRPAVHLVKGSCGSGGLKSGPVVNERVRGDGRAQPGGDVDVVRVAFRVGENALEIDGLVGGEEETFLRPQQVDLIVVDGDGRHLDLSAHGVEVGNGRARVGAGVGELVTAHELDEIIFNAEDEAAHLSAGRQVTKRRHGFYSCVGCLDFQKILWFRLLKRFDKRGMTRRIATGFADALAAGGSREVGAGAAGQLDDGGFVGRPLFDEFQTHLVVHVGEGGQAGSGHVAVVFLQQLLARLAEVFGLQLVAELLVLSLHQAEPLFKALLVHG